MTASILVVDDEAGIRTLLADILTDEGYSVVGVESGEAALAALTRELFDLILLDVALPGMDGIETLMQLRAAGHRTPVVAISGHAGPEQAVEAVKQGAVDFLEKPLALERVLVTVHNALTQGRLRERLELERDGRVPELTGTSPAINELRRQLLRAAASDARVLITGPNGVGKEVVARLLHRHSPRSRGPLVTVNCAALPAELIESELFGHVRGAFTGATESRRGKFEVANGGTVFLDEVGDMSLLAQAKVLRVLEDSRVTRVGGSHEVSLDVRVIAATNKDLEAEVAAGRFRQDLYFRLDVVHLAVPALAQRVEDIPLLVDDFVAEMAGRDNVPVRRFSPEAMAALQRHSWPGNVRELRNMVERLLIMSPDKEISPAELGLASGWSNGVVAGMQLPLRQAREEFEKAYVREMLTNCSWNMSQAARLLGLERSHLYRKLRALGIWTVDRSGDKG